MTATFPHITDKPTALPSLNSPQLLCRWGQLNTNYQKINFSLTLPTLQTEEAHGITRVKAALHPEKVRLLRMGWAQKWVTPKALLQWTSQLGYGRAHRSSSEKPSCVQPSFASVSRHTPLCSVVFCSPQPHPASWGNFKGSRGGTGLWEVMANAFGSRFGFPV